MRVLAADIEALLPLFRLVLATASVALKQNLGGLFSRSGGFRRSEFSSMCQIAAVAVSIAMVGTGLYVALAS